MKIPHGGRPINILLVEDNPGDVRLTKEAFKEGRLLNEIEVVMDGVEAMDYLKKRGQYASATRPDLILLDLNLPKKNGHEVLKEIKSDDSLRLIPVIILTTSKAERDILEAYGLNANSYVSKPVDMNQFMEVVKAFEFFWFMVATLPPKEQGQA